MQWSNCNDFLVEPWFSLRPRNRGALREELNRIFEGVPTSAAQRTYPAVNLWSNTEEAIVTAEIPGIDTNELDVQVRGSALTIRGQKNGEPVQDGQKFLRRERSAGSFTRTIELPFPVDPDRVDAVYQNGVLQLTLPRVEADKPRKIQVKQ